MGVQLSGFRAQRRSEGTHEDVHWTIEDEDYLADVVALVALGQARHAAALISTLSPIETVITQEQLRNAAISRVEIEPGTPQQEAARRWQRDGLLFEILSWIALVETHIGKHYLILDPHLTSTTQGLDGLLLELDPETLDVIRAVIVEDKCSEHPRRTFRELVMPAFEEHHANGRAPDLVAAAASLLHHLEGPEAATSRASAILDINLRGYRASIALESGFESSHQRPSLSTASTR